MNAKNSGILFIHDTLNSLTYGTVRSNSAQGIDCSSTDSVRSFSINYSQPAGTNIYFAFCTGGNWFKLNSSGNAENISTAPPSFADLAENGNTVAQLLALTNIPAFVKKKIQIITGLSATPEATAMPRVKLSVNAAVNEQLTVKNEYSPVYELGDDATITNITYDGSSANGGSISVKAHAVLPNDTATDWLDIPDILGSPAKTLQLRATLAAPTINSSSATINNAYISYFNSQYSAVEGKGDIITQTLDWHLKISQCRVNIRHSPLGGSTMRVFAALRKTPILVQNEQLGIGSGQRKTFQMAHIDGIRYDTVKVFYDSVQIFSGWELNGEVGRITCSAQSGVIVSCTYEYGWGYETWRELSRTSSYSLEDYDESEYRLQVKRMTYHGKN